MTKTIVSIARAIILANSSLFDRQIIRAVGNMQINGMMLKVRETSSTEREITMRSIAQTPKRLSSS
jgi:hypothetical protein